MKSIFGLIIYTCLVVLLGACGPTATPTPNPGPSQVWITSPASGAILPLGSVDLTFEGASFVGITEFEIRVDGSLEATVVPSGSGSCGPNCGTKFFGEYTWNPPDVGMYTIALRAFGNGSFSSETEIEIEISEVTFESAEQNAEAEEADPLIPAPLPTSTPTPKVQIGPEKVFVVGLKNGNCREGGGNQYNIVDALMQDQVAEAVAISEDGFYVKIIGPAWNIECWVWIELVNVETGELNSLAVEPYPPAPAGQPGAPNPAPSATPVRRP